MDTVEDFLSFQTFSDMANSAPVPQGYAHSFSNLQGSVHAHGYLGVKTLKTYNTVTCAQLCDAKLGCMGFNIYFERDPTLNPAEACPNPPSFTNIKCTLWGAGVTEESATNTGQHREDFQVVIAGSNGYNKNTPPQPLEGYEGPTQLGGAINAPLYNGVNTYLGMKYFNIPYDPSVCAAACQAQTGYNSRHATNGVYKPCVSSLGFFPFSTLWKRKQTNRRHMI